ncbi:hypothetical protein G6F45_014005 [Rhizopus arrhizus]|nr:hypothetical protein G6F45_014005 [Rhizopus arrhizus]
MVGDGACHRGRTVHAGQDADVVARGNAAVGAHDAVERGRLRHVVCRVRALPHGIVALEVREFQVLRVHRRTGWHAAMARTATLWPGGTRPCTVTPSLSSRVPLTS